MRRPPPTDVVAQRKKLSHAGPKTVAREAELTAPTGVGSGDLLGSKNVITQILV
jgi:hypothetical protein